MISRTISSEDSGFGLGLAICQGIITSHGGTIGAKSQIGKGSSFWFSIARYETHPEG
ncbi:MAG: hypothetical protein K8F91_25355 [Candidatus Obscuribacterales bacterium]|nr:hypothetical protein [Candidatus Obscuribacterales bacterium]